jgi:hypothetical protein
MSYDATKAAEGLDLADLVAGQTREYLATGIEAHYLTDRHDPWAQQTIAGDSTLSKPSPR